MGPDPKFPWLRHCQIRVIVSSQQYSCYCFVSSLSDWCEIGSTRLLSVSFLFGPCKLFFQWPPRTVWQGPRRPLHKWPLLKSAAAEALRAKIDWKLAFCKGVGQYPPNFRVEGDQCCAKYFLKVFKIQSINTCWKKYLKYSEKYKYWESIYNTFTSLNTIKVFKILKYFNVKKCEKCDAFYNNTRCNESPDGLCVH